MKTKFTLLTAFVATFVALNAQQVPNGGFENWGISYKPDGWATVDGIFGSPLGFTTKDTVDKVEGSASIKLVSDSLSLVPQAGVIPGLASLGTATYAGGQPAFYGIPFAFRPDTLFFSYKYSTPGADTAGVQIVLFKSGSSPVLAGGIPLGTTNNQWVNAYVILTPNYSSAATPDTLLIQFFASFNDVAPNVKGSTLLVDRVRFGYVNPPSTSIANVADNGTISVYPNPASDIINIAADVNLAGYTFEVMDVTGKVVTAATLTGETSTVNISELTKGNYIYRITDKSNAPVKQSKFAIVK
ncbi:MAG: T9SS type A sorting domain-containing protein [Chitinophagales bacterium]|nr:T9SS type A sorting domain-containing protein [Chitinophagales bacterium]